MPRTLPSRPAVDALVAKPVPSEFEGQASRCSVSYHVGASQPASRSAIENSGRNLRKA
ncbi:MAG: hypothetical protein K0R38_2324 [Polyangiaceae bacterium]|jgi:hypothetical protein|nr:hypothetical protein [Polyangiaceae bacterium]